MSVDKSKMVLTFKHPRISRGEQERLGRAHFTGIEPHVLHVGVLPKLSIDVARATREGDEVWFYGLNMIVAPRKDAEEIGATQITMFIKTIAANRATGIEGISGRTTAKRSQCTAMVNEAHTVIGRGGKRLPRSGKPAGRRPKYWPTEKIKADALKMWTSKNIPSDAAAVREIMARWDDLVDDKGKPLITERLIRTLGDSGRPKP
jgi:hypothetical protein